MQTYVAGQPISKYKESDEQYDIWLRAEAGRRRTPDDVGDLTVRAHGGALVRLRNLVRLREDLGPAEIDRVDRQRSVTIVANLLPELPLATAIAHVNRIAAELDMPPLYNVQWTGRAKTLAESNLNFVLAFGLSIVFMYMVLAAQFESFVHPVTIMLALPLTVPFALFSLVCLGEALNVYSMLGLFMLFGIVKKNGILQIDYTNTLRARGVPRDEAIRQANRPRSGTGLGIARLDRARDRRRAGALLADHVAHHTGRLLAVRRPARLASLLGAGAGGAPEATPRARPWTRGYGSRERGRRLASASSPHARRRAVASPRRCSRAREPGRRPVPPSGRLLHAGSERQRHRIDPEAADGALPHVLGRRLEDEPGVGRRREPGRGGELAVELAGAPARVAEEQPTAPSCELVGRGLEQAAQHLDRGGQVESVRDPLRVLDARVITEEQEAALRLDRAAAPEHEPAVALHRRIERNGLRGPQVRRTVHDEADRSVAAVLAQEDHAAGEVLVLELRHRDEQRRRERVRRGHARMVTAALHLVKPQRAGWRGVAYDR